MNKTGKTQSIQERHELDAAEILITGGTGSLGHMLTYMLQTSQKFSPHGIRIFSRSELPQKKMEQRLFNLGIVKNVSFLIGDVCDYRRLCYAAKGCTHVIHAAAMKHVTACENNPSEAIKTNIIGSENVLHASIESQTVRKVVYISTDKAVYPVNFYGMTKAVAEKLFVHGNTYSPKATNPQFSCIRYGNVVGSRGSVIPLFQKQVKKGEVTITNADMTRFWITLDEACKAIFYTFQSMEGGEIFIPALHSMYIMDLVEAVSLLENKTTSGINIKMIGNSHGEKIHETLIANEEFTHLTKKSNYFVIMPPTSPQVRIVDTTDNNYSYTSDRHLFLKRDVMQGWIEDLKNKEILKGLD